MMKDILAFIWVSCFVFALAVEDVDPCKRQPFRGRCPPDATGLNKRSQFVLRYFQRNNECVSYPFGHCSQDENEPVLYRYKEECEDACIRLQSTQSKKNNKENKLQKLPHQKSTGASENQSKNDSLKGEGFSECLYRRSSSQQDSNWFVPVCTKTGEFRALQCERNGKQCFCVFPDGREVPNSRKRIGKPPNCHQILNAVQSAKRDCLVLFDRGPCTAAITKWYYDESNHECKQFTYSGCGGNGNNYDSRTLCEKQCGRNFQANLMCTNGEMPFLTNQNRIHDCSEASCPTGYKCLQIEQHQICCPGDAATNDRSNDMLEHLDATVCNLPRERGPCDRYELRFYYSNELNECKYFFFGGCDGNANNFQSVEDCENTCRIADDVQRTTDFPQKDAHKLASTRAVAKAAPSLKIEPKHGIKVPISKDGIQQKFEATNSNLPEAEGDSSDNDHTKATNPDEDEEMLSNSSMNEATISQKSSPENFDHKEPVTGNIVSEVTFEIADYDSSTSEPSNEQSTWEGSHNTPSDSAQSPSQLTPIPGNRCEHSLDRGTCSGAFTRWFWNSDREVCQVFSYTGCDGNGNNFDSEENCTKSCRLKGSNAIHELNICEQTIESGDCDGTFMRFGFDQDTGECLQFHYTGCGGNGNNFPSVTECRMKCSMRKGSIDQELAADACQHPLDVGTCTGTFNRYAYDIIMNECRRFVYGGCGGNGNNFATHAECNKLCVKEDNFEKSAEPKCSTIAEICSDPCKIAHNEFGCSECICETDSNNELDITESENDSRSPTNVDNRFATSLPREAELLASRTSSNSLMTLVKSTATPVMTTQSQKSAPNEIETRNRSDECLKEVDAGPCKNNFARWYFNFRTRKCEQFRYGGCGGNENHYFLKDTCKFHCARYMSNDNGIDGVAELRITKQPQGTNSRQNLESTENEDAKRSDKKSNERSDVLPENNGNNFDHTSSNEETCRQPPDAGPCSDYVTRWFYNTRNGKCEQFSYGSCGGNTNNFLDREVCESLCQLAHHSVVLSLSQRCKLSKDEGSGNDYHVKWYFNIKNLRCEQLVFKGNGGNQNRFSTLGDCQKSCNLNEAAVPSKSIIGTDQRHIVKPDFPRNNSISNFDRFARLQSKPTVEIDKKMQKIADREQHNLEDIAYTTRRIEIEEATSGAWKETGSHTESPHPTNGNHLDDNHAKVEGTKIHELTSIARKRNQSNGQGQYNPSVPPCPNSMQPMQYSSGRIVMCLPGSNQCPVKSSCYFNGLDFYCCPNDEDPYDKHVFGGYDGEETKRGYKISRFLRQLREAMSRHRRQLHDQVDMRILNDLPVPSLFDSQSLRRYSSSRTINDVMGQQCTLDVDAGSCNEAHLRYFYQSSNNSCKAFHYGGCEGNANNYASLMECERICKTHASIQTTKSLRICPDNRIPLGDNAPVICGNATHSIACPPKYFCHEGSPNICCPSTDKIDLASISSSISDNIRWSPRINHHDTVRERTFTIQAEKATDQSQGKGFFSISSTTAEPDLLYMICTDGSDALMDITRKLVQCGSGFDSKPLCPIGYYCTMNVMQSVKVCCPMQSQGSNIPPPLGVAPHFGIRRHNPGEVITHGSLPSDQISAMHEANYYGSKKDRLMKSQIAELRNDDNVRIDIVQSDPFEMLEANKLSLDVSICHTESSEGRVCQEGETGSRTNLQYFYSKTEKTCKLFFYRRCGGNANRFETKKQCESLCMVSS